MRRPLVSLTLSLLLICMATGAQGANRVWSGLVMATNAPEPTPIPAELDRFEGTLKRLFGYNQFQVIGQSQQNLETGDEEWRATSKYFSLQVISKPAAQSAYRLNLQLFQEQKLLLAMQANLSRNRPIMVRGPQVGEGQLVLLLVME